jgi:hypothetical protein
MFIGPVASGVLPTIWAGKRTGSSPVRFDAEPLPPGSRQSKITHGQPSHGAARGHPCVGRGSQHRHVLDRDPDLDLAPHRLEQRTDQAMLVGGGETFDHAADEWSSIDPQPRSRLDLAAD